MHGLHLVYCPLLLWEPIIEMPSWEFCFLQRAIAVEARRRWAASASIYIQYDIMFGHSGYHDRLHVLKLEGYLRLRQLD